MKRTPEQAFLQAAPIDPKPREALALPHAAGLWHGRDPDGPGVLADIARILADPGPSVYESRGLISIG